MLSRLNWRQRLIAIAVGIAVAALQAYAPTLRVHHAAAATPAPCAVQTVGNS